MSTINSLSPAVPARSRACAPGESEPAAAPANPFATLLAWQRRHEAAQRRLGEIEASISAALAAAVAPVADEYAEVRAEAAGCERRLTEIAATHPEWRDGQSIRTPLGRLEFRAASRLNVVNSAASILLVETLVGPQSPHECLRRCAAEQFITTEKKLKLEALEGLDDGVLRAFGIFRNRSLSITVKPARPDFGRRSAAAPAAPVAAA